MLNGICAGKQCLILHEITQDTLADLPFRTTFLGARALYGNDLLQR